MTYLLIAAAFTVTPDSSVSFASASSATSYLSKRIETGTLLLSKGDCLAVKVFTRSRYTHAAAVVVTNGVVYIYESANGVGVRKRTLRAYMESESPDVIYVLNPKTPFSRKRARILRRHLESELGRPYGIRHHFTGKRAEGLHCSEYLTDALQACNVITAKRPSRVSPSSLAQGLLESNLYRATVSVQVCKPAPKKPVGRNRCEQLWIDTKFCTINFCIKCRRWFACR